MVGCRGMVEPLTVPARATGRASCVMPPAGAPDSPGDPPLSYDYARVGDLGDVRINPVDLQDSLARIEARYHALDRQQVMPLTAGRSSHHLADSAGAGKE